MGSMNLLAFFFALLSACYMGAAKVVLTEGNATLSFDDSEANFTPKIKGSGECGILYLAEPLDACTVLTNKAEQLSNVSAPFVLIVRGGCSFEEKVTRAQNAGFKSAIVYDNEDYGLLVAMAGNSVGINIHAVFVSKASGQMLKKYAGLTNVELWIIPSFENTAWFIMLKSFISLLGMSAVLATCFFIRRHCIRRERPRASSIYRVHGVSRRVVKAMPTLIFTADLEDNCTSGTCAICLVDYSIGEKLRILPCHHKFHVACVDTWLTLWRTFCPVCKRDAITGLTDPPPSESTPLLSVASSISSGRSSLESQPVSHNHRVASTLHVHPSFWSNHQLPSLTVSHNSANFRNASQRSLASPLDSSHSMAYPFDSAESLSECEVV